MKDKINIAELLKDCPKGMELDCIIFNGKVYFEGIDDNNSAYPIKISVNLVNIEHLDIYGQYNTRDYSKCVIYPKGKTTWEGFVPPCQFKDGDILYCNANDDGEDKDMFKYIFIFDKIVDVDGTQFYYSHCHLFGSEFYTTETNLVNDYPVRFATEEEKERLFQAIKDKGYKWNPVTKTLEKLPKFKVGNKVKRKGVNYTYIVTIVGIYEEYYTYVNQNGEPASISIKNQDEWELVPNKFDITTLVPFKSRVLVRDNDKEKWHPAFWGFHDVNSGYPYKLIGCIARYCIPYEGNKHLLGTTDDCDEYFKTWE